MAKLTKEERHALTRRRILSVLRAHTIANARTLEQKICDAGPFPMRVDPHILTPARQELVREGRVLERDEGTGKWFYLSDAKQPKLDYRFNAQIEPYRQFVNQRLQTRLGQTLEIAIYKSLMKSGLEFYGQFVGLDAHEDDKAYIKEEPPSHISSRRLPNQERLDFMVRDNSHGFIGIEAKNIRPWIYPHSEEVKDLIRKCLVLDCIPVLIARRISFVAFSVLNACGCIMHQTYNQLIPNSEADLSEKLRDKNLLGYHDIRTGNDPDARLDKFIGKNLQILISDARKNFDDSKTLLDMYCRGSITQQDFNRQIRYEAWVRRKIHIPEE